MYHENSEQTIKNPNKVSIHESIPELAPEPTKDKKSKLKLQQEFMNEITADEKDINDQIFWDYWKYRNPLFLAKDLIRATQAKNEKFVNNINDGLIDLRNTIIRIEIPENKNPNQIVDIVEKILKFDKQQKGKWNKILTPKEMLQRLSIALTQVKTGNTSENLQNEIR